MRPLDNEFLRRAYDAANEAVKNQSLSGEDTVMQLETGKDAGFLGRKWVRLGGRSDEFKAQNLRMRDEFFKNLTSLFGGADRIKDLPKDLQDALKLHDFKLDGGEVKSDRPLTARRIIAIYEAAQKWSETQKAGEPEVQNLAVNVQKAGEPEIKNQADRIRLDWLADRFVEKYAGQLSEDEIGKIKAGSSDLSGIQDASVRERAQYLSQVVCALNHLDRIGELAADPKKSVADVNACISKEIGTVGHSENAPDQTVRGQKQYLSELVSGYVRVVADAVDQAMKAENPQAADAIVSKLLDGNVGVCIELRITNLQNQLLGQDDDKSFAEVGQEIFDAVLKDEPGAEKLCKRLKDYYGVVGYPEGKWGTLDTLERGELIGLAHQIYLENKDKDPKEFGYELKTVVQTVQGLVDVFADRLSDALVGKRALYTRMTPPAEAGGNWLVEEFYDADPQSQVRHSISEERIRRESATIFRFFAEDVLGTAAFDSKKVCVHDERVQNDGKPYDYESEMCELAGKVQDELEGFAADVEAEITAFDTNRSPRLKLDGVKLQEAVKRELDQLKNREVDYEKDCRPLIDQEFRCAFTNRERLVRLVAIRVFNANATPEQLFAKNLLASAQRLTGLVFRDDTLRGFAEHVPINSAGGYAAMTHDTITRSMDRTELTAKIVNALKSFKDNLSGREVRLAGAANDKDKAKLGQQKRFLAKLLDEKGEIRCAQGIVGGSPVTSSIQQKAFRFLETLFSQRFFRDAASYF